MEEKKLSKEEEEKLSKEFEWCMKAIEGIQNRVFTGITIISAAAFVLMGFTALPHLHKTSSWIILGGTIVALIPLLKILLKECSTAKDLIDQMGEIEKDSDSEFR